MFQVWYCTSSRSHTTVAKYAEYIATSFKEAKERLGDKFSINPKVTQNQSCEYQTLHCVLSKIQESFPKRQILVDHFSFSPNLLIRFPSFISIFTPTDALSDPPISNIKCFLLSILFPRRTMKIFSSCLLECSLISD